MGKKISQKEWAERYRETVLFKEVEDVINGRVWRLQTGDPEVARRIRKKRRFNEISLRWMSGPCRLWFFETSYDKRGNVIRSLSRILRRDCFWDEKRRVIAVRNNTTSGGITS
jgi:hypothetical protein